jgi:hypothetical protein
MGSEVVDRRAILVELHVEAGEDLIAAREKTAIEVPSRAFPAPMFDHEGPLPPASLRDIRGEGHDLLALYVFPLLEDCFQGILFEPLHEEDLRIFFNAEVPRIPRRDPGVTLWKPVLSRIFTQGGCGKKGDAEGEGDQKAGNANRFHEVPFAGSGLGVVKLIMLDSYQWHSIMANSAVNSKKNGLRNKAMISLQGQEGTG